MINSATKNAVEKTLDLADRNMSPQAWSKWPRRIYLFTLPLSWPLLSLWCMLVMLLVFLAMAICGIGALSFRLKDYCAVLWKGDDE